MNLDLLLKIYSFLGSTIAFVLAYFQIRDRYPRIVIRASQSIAKLRVKRDNGGAYGPTDVPVIKLELFNHGKITIYPKEFYLLINRRVRVNVSPLDLSNSYRGFKFGPVEADRSVGVLLHGQDVFENFPSHLQESKRISVQAITTFENGKQFKSRSFTVVPASLQSNIKNQ